MVKFNLTLGNHFSGFGIKKLKAYKSQLPFDELYKLKVEFWSREKYKIDSKKENKQIWQILKQCCETDACIFL